MKTIGLLAISNTFMTVAWYGHLKFKEVTLWKVILISWGIAFFEYCLMVPANRNGYTHGLTGYQLKVIQEVITLSVFAVFAWVVLKEKLTWYYAVSFGLVVAAVYFATAFTPAQARRPAVRTLSTAPQAIYPEGKA